MRIFFIRHGESEANLLHLISNRTLRHGLTPTGREQADRLARRFQDHQVTKIFSSPLLRALETSEILADRLAVETEEVDALREFDCGVLEGRSDPESWMRWQELVDAWQDPRNWDRRIPGGESFLQIRERFEVFLETLIDQYQQSEAEVLCVGHGGVYQLVLSGVLTDTRVDWRIPFLGHGSCIETVYCKDGLVFRRQIQ